MKQHLSPPRQPQAQGSAQRPEAAASGGQTLLPPRLALQARPLQAKAAPIQRDDETATQNTINAAAQARTIFEAVDGLGTDEDAIYRTLRPLTREQVKLLKRTYQGVYGTSLLAALRDDLNDNELRIALIFMFYWPSQYGRVLGSYQVGQAQQKMLELPGYSLNTLTNLIDIQPSAQHRAYIYKALAAGNSILDIITFAYQIYNKDATWLQNNLRLTQQTGGSGLQQSWQHSCGPTTVQAVQGELDPIYALRMRTTNTDITTADTSSAAAADQRTMLEANGGTAVARGSSGGAGMGFTGVLNLIKSRTGVDYSMFVASNKSTSMTDVNNVLDQGLPVPIRVGGTNGGHFVLVTHRSGNSYNIHDVWVGSSLTRTRANFVNNTMNVAGWPNFTHYGKPD